MEERKRCRLRRCNKVLVQQPGEPDWNFERREHCDRSCAAFRRNEERKKGTKPPVEKTKPARAPTVEKPPDAAATSSEIQELLQQRMMRGALV